VAAIGGVVPAVRDARGALLGGWRPAGRGRVGVWLVEDSFGLVSAGHGDRYGEWWSGIVSAIARPDTRPVVRIGPLARAGERMAVCDLPPGTATMTAPSGARAVLIPDKAAGGCAGYWPGEAGWHALAGGLGLSRAVYVQPAGALAGVRAAMRREATMALTGSAVPRGAEPAGQGVRGSSWPWFLGWLAVASLTWWVERARPGRRRG
jgi:hypothetical protein